MLGAHIVQRLRKHFAHGPDHDRSEARRLQHVADPLFATREAVESVLELQAPGNRDVASPLVFGPAALRVEDDVEKEPASRPELPPDGFKNTLERRIRQVLRDGN